MISGTSKCLRTASVTNIATMNMSHTKKFLLHSWVILPKIVEPKLQRTRSWAYTIELPISLLALECAIVGELVRSAEIHGPAQAIRFPVVLLMP